MRDRFDIALAVVIVVCFVAGLVAGAVVAREAVG